MSEESITPPPAKRRRTRHDQGIKPQRTPLPQSLYHLAAQDLQPRQAIDSPIRPSPAAPASQAPITLEQLRKRRLAYAKKNEADARRRRLLKGKDKEVDGQDDEEVVVDAPVLDDGGEEDENPRGVRMETDSQILDINIEDDLPPTELLHALHHYASHFYSSMSIIGTLQTPNEWAESVRHRREARHEERSNRFAGSRLTSHIRQGGSSAAGDSADAGSSSGRPPFKTQGGRSTFVATTYSQRSHPLDLVDPPAVIPTSPRHADFRNHLEPDVRHTEHEDHSETGSRSTNGAWKSVHSSSESDPDEFPEDLVYDETLRQEGSKLTLKWRKEKKRDMRQAFNGSALMALGILMQEKTVSLLKEAGYVDDNEAKAPGGRIDLDVLFPKALLGRATPSKGKTADVVRVPTNDSVGSELPVKKKERQT